VFLVVAVVADWRFSASAGASSNPANRHPRCAVGEGTDGSASSKSRTTSTDTYSGPFERAFFTRRHRSHSYHTDPRFWKVVHRPISGAVWTRLPGALTVGVAGENSESRQCRVFTGEFQTNRRSLEQTETNPRGKCSGASGGKKKRGKLWRLKEATFSRLRALSRRPPQLGHVNMSCLLCIQQSGMYLNQ
jgi:hypothetical protein